MSEGKVRYREGSWISVAAALIKTLAVSTAPEAKTLEEAKRTSGFEVATLRRAMKAYDFMCQRLRSRGGDPAQVVAPMSSIEALERLARKAPRAAEAILSDVAAGKTSYREVLRIEKSVDRLFDRPFDEAVLASIFSDGRYERLTEDDPMAFLPTAALRPDFVARAALQTLAVYLSPRFAPALYVHDSVEGVLAKGFASLSFYDRAIYLAADLQDELDARLLIDRCIHKYRCLEVTTPFQTFDY